MAEPARSPVAILGVGNDLRGDDAVGLETVRRIRARAERAGILAREQPADPLSLLAAWHGRDVVVIVDAMAAGDAPPGIIRRFDVSAVPLPVPLAEASSTHGAGVGSAIELARALNRLPPRVIVYAVQGASFTTGAPLSAPVRAALPALGDAVLAEAMPAGGSASR